MIYVGGARQVGKSTLLKQSLPSVPYVSLDDPLIRNMAVSEPQLFMTRYKPPVIIDEIQYAPGLFPLLKMAVDANRQPGMFWLSGSQPFHLLRNISESLAGRVGILDMLGLSTRELLGEPDAPSLWEWHQDRKPRASLPLDKLFERIWRGSYPELHANPSLDPDLFYRNYIRTYLERDVRDLGRVGDERAFFAFLRLVAARTGQLLNVNGLANEADITHATARSWLSILEASGVLILLEPYHRIVSKRVVKAPKLYMLDTGLAAWLSGWTTPDTLERGASAGAFLETYVVSECLKAFWHRAQEPRLHFYRDRDGREVDLLHIVADVLWPMEVKLSSQPDRQMVRQLQAAQGLGLKQDHGLLVCRVDQWFPLTEDVDAVPVGFV